MLFPSSLTLAAAKASEIKNISGVCPSSDDFLDLINTATKRLMTYGSWWGTVIKGRVCVYNGCVAWPRWVGTILAMNVAGSNRPIHNKWFEFLPLTTNDCAANRVWGSNVAVIDGNVTPVFNNIPCNKAFALQIHTRKQADIGKTMTFYGLDVNGQEMMSKNILGEWQQGVTVTLGIPDVTTTQKFQEVTRVSREATTDMVDVYQVDDENNVLLDMAHYEPSETEPRYRFNQIKAFCRTGCCTSTSLPQIMFLAKMQFVPVSADTDIVQIENVPALKLMVQAIRLEESGDDDSAMKKQAMAIKELNRELNDKLPLNQIPINLSPFGTALPTFAGIGSVH